jgi:hypothetical protein
MPDDWHKGYEYWQVGDLAHPYPIGDFDIQYSSDSGAGVTCSFVAPAAIPATDKRKKWCAERSVGIRDSYKFWVALECEQVKGGGIACEAVLRVRHMTAVAGHLEDPVSDLIEIRIDSGDFAKGGWRQEIGDHNPRHCDTLSASWSTDAAGKTQLTLAAFHWRETPAEFREAQRRAREEAEHGLTWPKPKLNWENEYKYDPKSAPKPRPKPKPEAIDP